MALARYWANLYDFRHIFFAINGQILHRSGRIIKRWANPGLFLFIFVFSEQSTVNKMFYIKNRWWLESYHGPQESDATVLPTEPLPLPSGRIIINNCPINKSLRSQAFAMNNMLVGNETVDCLMPWSVRYLQNVPFSTIWRHRRLFNKCCYKCYLQVSGWFYKSKRKS